MDISADLIKNLETFSEPGPLLAELDRRFGSRMALAMSGQPTDAAILALMVEGGIQSPRVYTTDTYRLFPETYAYFETLEKRFGAKIERWTPPERELTQMVERHGEYLFFDSKDKQEYCCHVRKVLPNLRVLDTLDVWVTGLRRDQSTSRAGLPRLEMIEHAPAKSDSPAASEADRIGRTVAGKRKLLKVNPLVDWTEKRVSDFLLSHKIPNHPLIEKKLPGGYRFESLGCILCTTPIAPHEASRAGRWRWFNALDDKKECGLHLPTST